MQISGGLLEERAAGPRRCDSCGRALADRVCANCGGSVAGPYCSQCGHREFAGRHTLRRMVLVPLGQLLNLYRGFLYSALRLTVAPGNAVRDYLAGRVALYTHPFIYLTISFTAFALMARWTDAIRPAPDPSWTWAFPVLFIAAVSRLLFWRVKLNYAEHLILGFYLFGQIMLFFAVLLFAILVISGGASLSSGAAPETRELVLFITATLSLSAGYIAWAYSRFFVRRPLLAAAGGFVAGLGGTALYVAALLAITVAILNAMRAHGVETVVELAVFYLRRLWVP